MNQEMPKEIESLFAELKNIFTYDSRKFGSKQKTELEKLGFEVYGETHPKLKIGKTIITLSSTASDLNTNRVVVRRIRKVLINEYKRGNLQDVI